MWPKLAWRNLTRDRRRCAVTIFGTGFAVFIMLFQTGLFVGFTQAASHIIRAMDGDLLISGRGASCLEYGFPIEARYGGHRAQRPRGARHRPRDHWADLVQATKRLGGQCLPHRDRTVAPG